MLHLLIRALTWLVLTPLFLLVMPRTWLLAPGDGVLPAHTVPLMERQPALDGAPRTATLPREKPRAAFPPRLGTLNTRVITVVLGSSLPASQSTLSTLAIMASTMARAEQPVTFNSVNQAPAASRVNTDLLNLRVGPGQVYNVVTVVDFGAPLTLEGRNEDCTWLQVRTATAASGWVVAEYVTLAEPCNSLPLGVAVQPPQAEVAVAHAPLQTAAAEIAQSIPPATAACGPIPDEHYELLSIEGAPTDRPAAQHPDLHLTVRGYARTQAELAVIEFDAADDLAAPQLSGLFADRRTPTLHAAYQVYDWDWGCDCRGPLLAQRGASLVGLAVQPGERIYTPDSGRGLGSGYEVLVLYASDDQITLKYTREDNVVSGYTLHLADLCVAPTLLALYQTADQAGRRQLPALRAGQAVGQAAGAELKLAIRDTGDFMDPRDREDWWR